MICTESLVAPDVMVAGEDSGFAQTYLATETELPCNVIGLGGGQREQDPKAEVAKVNTVSTCHSHVNNNHFDYQAYYPS
ncbi:hypothetical protein EC957_011276 [Mortierella hygrophila]|uniref:Uncharacterized protein n=1 Tax=Mortierella hygrophila TaxID=979708 RepID=A0A9P6F913_9FUNG|nr:hypothetical protein EC957_011276 [Mortierella hygrophila]